MKNSSEKFRILTNGRLRSLITNNGQGGLFYDWIALTRFSETAPTDCGPMLYLREAENWVLAKDFSLLDKLTFKLDAGIAPNADIEIRKITISNHSSAEREIELTSYTEISLNHPSGDAGHPAFSKLFVQTSVVGDPPVLLARRRPRGLNENWPWMAQTILADATSLTWETNRATFLGRGRTPLQPQAMDTAGALSCQSGNVLDPVMAWRCVMNLPANESKTVWLMTAAASDESSAMTLIQNAQESGAAEKLLDQAHAAENARLSNLKIDSTTAARYEAMAASMLFGREDLQAPTSLVGAESVHLHPLSWEEFRIVATAGLSNQATLDTIRALPFWRALGLHVRIFVLNKLTPENLPEGVICIDPTSFRDGELSWWLASSQLIVGDKIWSEGAIEEKCPSVVQVTAVDALPDTNEPLQCFNGFGGFSADGREYVIPMALKNGRLQLPPMPWINVLANSNFGCIVSERGAGYTWSRNSQANRLTPWSNDPISDPYGEAIYLRDNESGTLWSPLPGPLSSPVCIHCTSRLWSLDIYF